MTGESTGLHPTPDGADDRAGGGDRTGAGDRALSTIGPLPPLANFGAVLLDLDGTVFIDGDPLAGAADFIGACIDSGCIVSYVTNLSLWPKSHCLDALEEMGLPTMPRRVLTAADVLMTTLDAEAPGRNLGVAVADHLKQRLEIAGYRVHDLSTTPGDACFDALVVGQTATLEWSASERAMTTIEAGAPVFATSTKGRMPTRVEGVLSADEVLQHLLDGRDANIIDCGKPSQNYSAAIDERVEIADPVLVVGDSLPADIGLAVANGWFGLLVGPRPAPPMPCVPDYWAPDLAAALEGL